MINDVKNLKESGGASIAELREFLKGLKSRNPQEVIGIVSTSLLVQSMATSTVLTVGLMAVFTIGPYMLYGPPQAQTPSAKPNKTAPQPNPEPKTTTAETPAATGTNESSNPASPSTPDAAKAAKVMGLDETKAADPKKNPLDKPDLDKLLDGL